MDNNGGGRQATVQEHEIELIKQQSLASMSNDLEAALNKSAGGRSCYTSIFKVPQALAKGFAEACRPHIVSIGPYHHGEPELQKLEGHKWRCLQAMLNRTEGREIYLKNLTDAMAPKEKMIREWYSESTDDFSGPDLVKMMVLDGCFIVEFLRQIAGVTFNDILSDNLFLQISIKRDLLRLENQLPYFVLEDLLQMTAAPQETDSLAHLAFHTFKYFGEELLRAEDRWVDLKGLHLLDLFRLSIVPSNPQDRLVGKSSSYSTVRSASELRRVGIKFKKGEASTFLEIIFHRKSRTIEIPKVAIHDDELNWILTNMVALNSVVAKQTAN